MRLTSAEKYSLKVAREWLDNHRALEKEGNSGGGAEILAAFRIEKLIAIIDRLLTE